MAPTKTDKNAENDKADKKLHKIGKPCAKTCGVQSPGPKYNLRTLVGYHEHCLSKVREPAYTIGKRKFGGKACTSPGPKYNYSPPWDNGFTIPKAVYRDKPQCIPGPQYTLPGFWSPAYSITPKPRLPCPKPTSGPYDPPKYDRGPAFPFGTKAKDRQCEFNPPLRDVGKSNLESAPAYSITGRHPDKRGCIGPGPKYLPNKQDKSPAYSFGLKHSECSRIPRTECDELC